MLPHQLQFVWPIGVLKENIKRFFPYVFLCKNVTPNGGPTLPKRFIYLTNVNLSYLRCFQASYILSGQLILEKTILKDFSLQWYLCENSTPIFPLPNPWDHDLNNFKSYLPEDISTEVSAFPAFLLFEKIFLYDICLCKKDQPP